ncbi:TetR family transcriptional regulator [Alicyclobacillus macrosporangiidus]|uniref:DNA-binding transcriptional regulator, AcrR family n=1 Tax=Alicyclobacillus macrosporangiidus TaxID=392015 RepID=A0A1I7KVY2_9BACL|nr:TetR family transcriptional regulator [Alicyclobacillus macrosporangiidus]SFV01652.1 DNA-binding transcriptional regulator, AcrR family [Alicyclobacillus macrosporangiidus]
MSPKVTEEHKEQRKREIVEAAKRVFKRKGFAQATMHDIVEESGMSRGGVYMYFSSKEEIFDAILEQNDAELFAGIREMVDRHETMWGVVEEFIEMAEHELPNVTHDIGPVVYEVLMGSWRDEEKRALAKQRYQQTVDMYVSILQHGVESGEFRPILPIEDIAKSTLSFIDGLTLHILHLGRESINLRGQLTALKAYLRHALQVQGGGDGM